MSPITPNENGGNIQVPIAKNSENAVFATYAVATEVAVDSDTKMVRVTSVDEPIYIKWLAETGDTPASGVNFDEFILAGVPYDFYVTSSVFEFMSIAPVSAAANVSIVQTS